MPRSDDGIYAGMTRRGISRRSFIQFCAAMAAALALPASYGTRIVAALETAPRLPLVWLRGQACGGDSQALFQATDPTVSTILVDLLSVDHMDALMAGAGIAADPLRLAQAAGDAEYIAVVEGSVPTGDEGMACVVAGRPFREIVGEVCAGAVATIAVGSCATDGGVSAASGGTSGATGISGFVPGGRLINLPGCPVNGDNLAATLVHYLTFRELPPADRAGRPLFAYGSLIHNQCERRAHFEFGEFVTSWGDEAAQKGWCLYKMGCKGPEAFANCPTQRYAAGRSWPVQAGHGCIGCVTPASWDAMGGAYARLPAPLPFAPNLTVDQIGVAALAGIAGVATVHGAASWVRGKRSERAVRRGTAPIDDGVVRPAEPTGEAGRGPAPDRVGLGTPELVPVAIEANDPLDSPDDGLLR